MSEREEAARLEGFALAEEMIAQMLERMAEDEDAGKNAPADSLPRSGLLRAAALAVLMGQHRTDEYDRPEDIGRVHELAAKRAKGRRGGLATAAKMTPEERKERGRKAIAARWAKRSEDRSG